MCSTWCPYILIYPNMYNLFQQNLEKVPNYCKTYPIFSLLSIETLCFCLTNCIWVRFHQVTLSCCCLSLWSRAMNRTLWYWHIDVTLVHVCTKSQLNIACTLHIVAICVRKNCTHMAKIWWAYMGMYVEICVTYHINSMYHMTTNTIYSLQTILHVIGYIT